MNKLNGRYIRQIPLIGTQGQEKLQSAKVAIIGVGALGTVAAELLVRSGVGSILLIDRDVVELSNLQRQSLFANSDISSSKVVAAKRRLLEINPEITIEIAPVHLSAKNISQTISDKINLVLDCTDNMNPRFLINDYTKKNMINWIFASAVGWSGMFSFIAADSACLRCQMPKKANGETCQEAGVIGAVTKSIASMQSNIAIQFLTGQDISNLKNKLFTYDAKTISLRNFDIQKDPRCKTCSNEFPSLKVQGQEDIVRFCSSGMFQVSRETKIDLVKLQKTIESEFTETILDEISLRFGNLTVFSDGRALIKAKTKESAVTLYDRYISN